MHVSDVSNVDNKMKGVEDIPNGYQRRSPKPARPDDPQMMVKPMA
jgi:hypothetical protein